MNGFRVTLNQSSQGCDYSNWRLRIIRGWNWNRDWKKIIENYSMKLLSWRWRKGFSKMRGEKALKGCLIRRKKKETWESMMNCESSWKKLVGLKLKEAFFQSSYKLQKALTSFFQSFHKLQKAKASLKKAFFKALKAHLCLSFSSFFQSFYKLQKVQANLKKTFFKTLKAH